jgi:crossover junction endodeoxyribonuclease RuvC
LGIDPGSRFLGFGIVELDKGRVHSVAHGVVRADPLAPLAERLKVLSAGLEEVLAKHLPDVVAVEGVFTHKNARSALILGHARGVALLLAAKAGLAVFEYAPAKVKRSVGAGGNDGKEAVARMVTMQLALKGPLERSDAYDALAVALCHVHHARNPLVRAARNGLAKLKAHRGLSGFAEKLKPSYVRPDIAGAPR